MALPEILRLSFPDQGALEREIATNIRYGRLFISDILDAPVLTEGMLVIVHPVHGRELRLLAQIVMVNTDGPMRGTGLALRSFGPDEAERVLAFVHEHTAVADAAKPLSLVPEPRQRATVPPTSPENDWSDLPTTGLTRQPPGSVPPREERASASPTLRPDAPDMPAAVIVPAVVVVPASIAPPASVATLAPAAPRDDDDWSDVASAVTGRESAASAQPEDDSAQEAGEAPLQQPSTADDAATSDVEADALLAADRDEASAEDDSDDDGSEAGSGDEPAPEDGPSEFDEDPSVGAAPAATDLQSSNRQERLRSLNVVEQLKIARRGELSDRVVVERLYGKQVWEALLQNPRLTLPEVARIARKGTVPRPLIEQIVGNASWTKAPNVRRALLSNPKLTLEGVMKLLALTPKHELKILEKATAYPMSVRDAARKLLRES